MIRSSAALMANDVSIRCRVRRSPFSIDPKFEEAQEMTSTMRNWESHHDHRQSKPAPMQKTRGNLYSWKSQSTRTLEADDEISGPEILLTPIIDPIREESPQRRSRRRFRVRPMKVQGGQGISYSIPISQIMVVETCSKRLAAAAQKLHITTLSKGYFEFDCLSRNGHDILLAFLQAWVAPERILDGQASVDPAHDAISRSSSVTSCLGDLDVDGLTDQHLQGQRETWPEKFSRRMGKVVNSLAEMSGLCDVSCCREAAHKDDCQRDSPPGTSFRYANLEMDEGSIPSVTTGPPSHLHYTRNSWKKTRTPLQHDRVAEMETYL